MEWKLDPAALGNEELLAAVLLDRGVITRPEHELVCMQARAIGIPYWRVILNLNLCSAEMLQAVLAGRQGDRSNSAAASKPGAGLAIRQILTDALTQADVPNLVDQTLEQAVLARATDVHLDPVDERKLRVRLRIDGQLHEVLRIPGHMSGPVVSRIKLLAGLDIVEKRDAQDGHIIVQVAGTSRHIRIATAPTARGERVVARIIDQQSARVGFDELGMEPRHVEIVTRLLHKPYGIVAVTGPVGSGKTTTLYACLHHLNLPSRNLMTVEDPVEYDLPGINQLQVEQRADWTFPKALRAMLRQDPDVIMVGEIRDNETAQIAVRASLTGGLVLTSMHASDAVGAIGSFRMYGVPGYLLSQSLLGVVAQRLVRTVSPEAVEEYVPSEAQRRQLRLEPGERPDIRLKRGHGSAADFGTGYRGRTGVFEVLEITDSLRELVARESTSDDLRNLARQEGMQPIVDHAILKVLAGITTLEEAVQVVLL
jgi:type IV pilus assembly protein PilB